MFKKGFIEGKSYSLQVLRRKVIASKYCHTWNTLGQWVRPLAVELAGGGGFVDASKTGVFVLLVAWLAMICCCRGWWHGLATVDLSQAKLTHSKHCVRLQRRTLSYTGIPSDEFIDRK